MPVNLRLAKPEHQVAYEDLCYLVDKHAGDVTPTEMLAIAANMIGKLIAMQDQRTITPDEAMEIVQLNIEAGNARAIEALNASEGSA